MKLGKNINFVLLLFIVGGALAEIYKWVGEDGTIHYSDVPASDRKTEKLHIEPPPPKDSSGKSREKFKKILEEQKQKEAFQKREAKEKEYTAQKKLNEKKLARLVREFGGTWTMEMDLEKECNKKYNLTCDVLLNWKDREFKKCKEAHGSDQDCEDDEYLLQFKPLTIEEQRKKGIQYRSRQRLLYNQ